jgi:hypothetical protein
MGVTTIGATTTITTDPESHKQPGNLDSDQIGRREK